MELLQEYADKLDAIKLVMEEDKTHQTFLDEEDDESYEAMRTLTEPYIQALYNDIAATNPLQLIPLEEALLDDGLEGIFLDKIIAYRLLRGRVTAEAKYIHSQRRLGEAIIFACNSSAFELIKDKIRLLIRLTFSLSTNIWNNKILEQINAKRAKDFLRRQLYEARKEDHARKIHYTSMKRRFKTIQYQSAAAPSETLSWLSEYEDFKMFLLARIENKQDNTTLKPHIHQFLKSDYFKGTPQRIELLIIFTHLCELEEEDTAHTSVILNEFRKDETFAENYFEALYKMLKAGHKFDLIQLSDVADALDGTIEDSLLDFYKLVDLLNGKTIMDEGAVNAVEKFSGKYGELSAVIRSFKTLLLEYVDKDVRYHLEEDYTLLFDTSMPIFAGLAEGFLEKSYKEEITKVMMPYLEQLMFFFPHGTAEFKAIKKYMMAAANDEKGDKGYDFFTAKTIRAMYRAERKAAREAAAAKAAEEAERAAKEAETETE